MAGLVPAICVFRLTFDNAGRPRESGRTIGKRRVAYAQIAHRAAIVACALPASRGAGPIPPSPSASSCPMPPAAAPTPWRASSPRARERASASRSWSRTAPGSGTTIGAQLRRQARRRTATPSLLGTSSTFAIAVGLYKKLPYDPATDFAPIALVAAAPFVLIVHPSLPVHSVAELVQLPEGQSGLQLCVRRRRLAASRQRRAVPHHGRPRHQECQLPRRRPGGADVVAGHVQDDVCRRRRLGARADPRRPAAGACGHHRRAGSTPCRTSRPCTRPASPAMRPMPGSRSSRRPRRRRRSYEAQRRIQRDPLVR